MSKRKLSEMELEALTERDEDLDWISEVSVSKPDIHSVEINDMLFEDGINTYDKAEEDRLTADPEVLD